MWLVGALVDEDIRTPPFRTYQRRKNKSQRLASLWLDGYYLFLDHKSNEDPLLDFYPNADQWLDLA